MLQDHVLNLKKVAHKSAPKTEQQGFYNKINLTFKGAEGLLSPKQIDSVIKTLEKEHARAKKYLLDLKKRAPKAA